ncbi:MAG: DUF2306 domain-containing protein [Paracoccaceae bacterium]
MAHQFVYSSAMFYLHVIAAPIALAIAPFQLPKAFRAKSARRHRLMGGIYCLAVFLGGSSGFVIRFSATHGPIAQSGFILLAITWVTITFEALHQISGGQIDLLREWIIRSMSLTFAGVTLRILLPAQIFLGVPFETAVQFVVWLCWAPNLLFAEQLIRATRPPAIPVAQISEQLGSELRASALHRIPERFHRREKRAGFGVVVL